MNSNSTEKRGVIQAEIGQLVEELKKARSAEMETQDAWTRWTTTKRNCEGDVLPS